MAKYNREMADLEEAMRSKTRQLDDIRSKHGERNLDHDAALREKDDEIEIYKSGMEQALEELEELKLGGGDAGRGASVGFRRRVEGNNA